LEIDIQICNGSHFKQLSEIRYKFKNKNNKANEDFISQYTDYLHNESELNRIVVFGAFDKSEIIGSINLIIVPKSPKPNSSDRYIGYITNTFVNEQYRNFGVGTRIMDMIKEYSFSNNVELLFVWPSSKSISFYERSGFSCENEIMECEILEY
jgi:RimJ/RimL family protein N-acetyltransferase